MGAIVTDPTFIDRLRDKLDEGPVIVEHWHYRGSRGPSRFVTEEWEELLACIMKAKPGDAFHFWIFDNACTDANEYGHGKVPDDDGCIPRRGAY